MLRSAQAGRLFASMLLSLTLVVCVAKPLFAHGIVGDRIFLSPIVGNDAFPDNAASLTVRRSDYEFSLVPELEKQLSDNSSVLFAGGGSEIEPGAQPDKSGPTDLSIYFRQAAYVSVRHELEITVSPFVVLPVGSRQIA
ncbi:MAG TPA: hypothetical protein VEU51_13510, partial [Candidatus Acidoferrales bacterium]|nr:hypothetical protein [Candidatus Acidoferrales bacterium]